MYSFFHPIAQTNTTKFDLKENENYISSGTPEMRWISYLNT